MKNDYCVPKSDVVARREGEDAFLFDPDTGNLLCVNRIGYFIWDQLTKKNGRTTIVRMIVDEHEGVNRDRAGRDYEAFVGKLRDSGFLGTVR
ncbi:MAG: PqqD family protein [Candidatus Omnitrophota bacterium]